MNELMSEQSLFGKSPFTKKHWISLNEAPNGYNFFFEGGSIPLVGTPGPLRHETLDQMRDLKRAGGCVLYYLGPHEPPPIYWTVWYNALKQ